ncbi:hypothetical protein DSCW_35660 [Desulfosarcina widdelii]|uniref:Uncharacterized protein n=1 Tax=Desulfosarcina widdelii TaxID=947919 RepID=A0A5K7Z7L2_9BACT|nr:hypothetical protein DSCW_35660 [Desulfosarcina widdelii]
MYAPGRIELTTEDVRACLKLISTVFGSSASIGIDETARRGVSPFAHADIPYVEEA